MIATPAKSNKAASTGAATAAIAHLVRRVWTRLMATGRRCFHRAPISVAL